MNKNIRPLLILGTGTLAVEIAEFVSDVPGIAPAGFIENMDRSRCRQSLADRPVYWVDELAGLAKTHCAICALATTHRSRFIEQAAAYNIPFETIVHPSAKISSKSTVGEGTIISPGVIIASHTQLGQHVFVNRGVLIGHHTKIGNYVTIQPGANIAGVCSIGNATYIGIGAVILDHISIGANAVIGAGAVVTKDVPDNVQVLGVPARIVKENIEGK